MSAHHYLIILAAALAYAAANSCPAQYQVNTQVNMQTNQGNHYGSNSGSMQYRTQNPTQNPMMRSEQRYQVSQSGMMKSELRGGAMQEGRGAPGGVMSFVPEGTALSRATDSSRPPPPPPAPKPTGSMRYSGRSEAAPSNLQLGSSWASQGDSAQISGEVSSSLVPSQQINGSISRSATTSGR